jgi:hypothetical protein
MTSEGNGQELVVVGVDGSAESVRALGWAARYATATGARVQALLGWRYPAAAGQAPVGVAPDPIHAQSRCTSWRSRRGDRQGLFRPAGRWPRRGWYGHPAQVLIGPEAADLPVAGSHGHGAFTGMLVGSVSIHAHRRVLGGRVERCLLSAACLPVPGTGPGTRTGGLPTTCRRADLPDGTPGCWPTLRAEHTGLRRWALQPA